MNRKDACNTSETIRLNYTETIRLEYTETIRLKYTETIRLEYTDNNLLLDNKIAIGCTYCAESNN